ncbi:sensor domain-containing diguanylate cyclase [Halomonas sp. CSM-2]|uniref:sensor domain-containing diguanylate cyclase n=1 Tax=Halomonas sp. CSM-2 TaxID=1975722 RepID=UPI000A2843A8|nr:GGDEF domain-containing protein [Halomonas sp. CSM-2]
MTGIISSDNTHHLAIPALPGFLQSDLDQCARLPSLPTVAIRVLEVAGYPDATLNDYANAIEQDPALTLRLISLANSAFYARQQTETHSCREATSRLGLDATLAAVLSFSLWRDRQSGDLIQRIWGRSIVSALAARSLAEQLCPEEASFVFTAALLQDIGMLALLAVYPKDAHDLYANTTFSHAQLSRGEHLRFGCDHSSVGSWLAAKWGVPVSLAQSISASHDEIGTQKETYLLCLRLSGPIADTWLSANPSQALATLLRQLSPVVTTPAISLSDLLKNVQSQLPLLTNLFELTVPSSHDTEALIIQAQQLLFQQTFVLNARLNAQQQELDELQQRQTELEERSRRDPLTGLSNRAWLEEQLHKRFEYCQTHDHTMSVVFIDLDHFKKLNDRFGHQTGDRVLERFGRVLGSLVREGDLAGRYGGEEFLIILPDESAKGAQRFAKRIAKRLAETPMETVDGKPLFVSVSIGIACLSDGGFGNGRELIDAADQSMYYIKRNGRGGISLYGH